METLALQKKYWKIYMTWWITATVALKNDCNWAEMKKSKAVVTIDGKTIDMAFVMLIAQVEDVMDSPDTALAYAKTLTKWLKQVAIERVKSYEAKTWNKMTITQLEWWMKSFVANMDEFPAYKLIYNTHK